MEIQVLYKLIDTIFLAQKKARHNNDYLTLMVNAEALLENLPTLINYSIDQESQYRKFEAKLASEEIEGKKPTGSYCETQAKATDFYKEWQKAKLFIDLMYEMVALSKKLAGSVDKELSASTR